MPILPLILLVCMVVGATVRASDQASLRDFAPFEFLLARSPFSLPTVEESSPVAERYALTGAAEWEGEKRVFVFDKTSQQRHIVSEKSGTANMVLLEYLSDPDPRKMRARVQIDGQVTTLAFLEAPSDGGGAGQPMPMAGAGQVPVPGTPNATGQNPQGAVVQTTNNGQVRRVIRRRIVSGAPDATAGQNPAAQPAPGQPQRGAAPGSQGPQ
jgi:hypothetical protein